MSRVIDAAERFTRPRKPSDREFQNRRVRGAYFGYRPGRDIGGDAA